MQVEQFLSNIYALLKRDDPRILMGVVGKPGAGKSTLVDTIKQRFHSDEVSIISQDGYHLSNEILDDIGARDRKGAPDTFDQKSFVILLQQVKSANEDVRFPIFHREVEASIEDEGVVPAAARVVVIEGNYLLSPEFGWDEVAGLLDYSFYIEIEDEIRLQRLIERHVRYGKSVKEAKDWALGPDEVNAIFIEKTRDRATGIIEIS